MPAHSHSSLTDQEMLENSLSLDQAAYHNSSDLLTGSKLDFVLMFFPLALSETLGNLVQSALS